MSLTLKATIRTINGILVFAFISLTHFSSLSQSASMGTTFCSTTTTACNTVSGCVDHSITVSGIGTLSLTQVLNAIQVSMGSPACQGNLSTYDFTLISPSPGSVTLNFIVDLTGGTTNGWVNTTFVDNPHLENIDFDYTATDQNLFNPWSIGYYAPDVDGSFVSTYNGINADGVWTFRVCEGATGNMISFNSACISFGTPVSTVNAIGLNHDNCATALCIDNTSLISADNDGATADPLYPGDVIDGCNWNNGNHESAWFKFQPTGTSATITLSGLDGPSGLGYQAIVLENTLGNGCPASAADFTVPIGGCPDDESINNTDYLSANGGGTSTSGNIYTGDINFNMEFNLSGLTPNKVYYLYVDGNTTTVDESFVVQLSTPGAGMGPNGTVNCSIPLAVELVSFDLNCEEGYAELNWQTASENNNDYFEIQQSFDGYNFTSIGIVDGNGSTNSLQSYQFVVEDRSLVPGYFRLKQVDFDGAFDFSPVKYANCKSDVPFVQMVNGEIVISNLDQITNCSVFDLSGRLIFQAKDITSFNKSLPEAFYFIQLETLNGAYSFKIWNK